MSQDPTKETNDNSNSSSSGPSSDQNSSPANDNALQIPNVAQPSLTSESRPVNSQTSAKPSTIKKLSDPLCAICLEPITDRTVADPCIHSFCRLCIELSLQRTSRCPICRRQIIRIMFNILNSLDFDQRDVEEREQINNLDEFDEDISGLNGQQTRRSNSLRLTNQETVISSLSLDGQQFGELTDAQRNFRELQRIMTQYDASATIWHDHPGNYDPEVRRRLIDEPREFVTVNAGQPDEYLLPAMAGPDSATIIQNNDERDVYVVWPYDNPSPRYYIWCLMPNQINVVDWEPNIGLARLVSLDRLESAIQEFESRRNRYQQQQQQQQQRQLNQIVPGVNETNNQQLNEQNDNQVDGKTSDKQNDDDKQK